MSVNERCIKSAVRRQGFWFVDVPRTSSTAVRLELARKFGPVNDKLKCDRIACGLGVADDLLRTC